MRKTKQTSDLFHPVVKAVLPLKTEAIDRAGKEARRLINNVLGELEAVEWDLNRCAPYPESTMNPIKWRLAHGRWELFRRVTTNVNPTRNMREPDLRKKDPASEAKFIKEAKENAAYEYDVFIAKLVEKIGTCDKADLTGNHVWTYSILTVSKTVFIPHAESVVERWKTTMICNVSKYGKLFNQWPSRKVK